MEDKYATVPPLPEEETQEVSKELWTEIATLAKIQSHIKELQAKEAKAKSELIGKLTEAGISNGYMNGDKVVSYTSSQQRRLDIDAVKAKAPDIYDKLCHANTGKYKLEYTKSVNSNRLTIHLKP